MPEIMERSANPGIAPRGFSRAIRRTSSSMCASVRGPPDLRFLLPSYFFAISSRCRRNRVSGVTSVLISNSRFRPIALALRSPKSGSALLCAERDWIPISGNFIPTAFVKGHWDDYAAARDSVGKPADLNIWRVARSILVGETNLQAQDYVQNPEKGMSFYFRYLRTLAAMRATPGEPSDEVRAEVDVQVNEALEDQVIAGDPQAVLDQLVAFRDVTGHFGTLLATGHDWDEEGLWRKSMTLLAEDVMPKFRQHCEATQ